MKQARPQPATPVWILALAAASAWALTAIAGCTLVGDGLTGVKIENEPVSCVKECNDFYKQEYEREQKLHLANVEECQALAQPDKEACLDAEAARHGAVMDALGEAKIECQNNCHRQGSGSAG